MPLGLQEAIRQPLSSIPDVVNLESKEHVKAISE